MALDSFLDKAKKAAAEAAAEAQKKVAKAAEEGARQAQEVASKVADKASEVTAEAQKKAAAVATEAQKKANIATEEVKKATLSVQEGVQNFVDDHKDEVNARITEAGTAVKSAATTAGNAIASAAATTGEYAVKAGKTVSGVQAYQDRKEAKKLHSESDAIVAEIEKGNEQKRKELNEILSEFGRVRAESLHTIVGRYLSILEEMGKHSDSKVYEAMLGEANITMENVGRMKQLDMGASEALKTLGVAGGFAGIALAGTPSLVTGAVTALATASTGTAISSLSGAAATNAVLAWLGGGSLAAGGGGIAAGTAVLTGITAATTGVFAVAAAGIVASAYFSKKLNEATEEKAKVEKWAEEVKKGWVLMDKIKQLAVDLRKLTEELTKHGGTLLDRLQDLVPKFDNTKAYHVELFQQSALLVNNMSELAQTPLLDDKGNISPLAISEKSKLEEYLKNLLSFLAKEPPTDVPEPPAINEPLMAEEPKKSNKIISIIIILLILALAAAAYFFLNNRGKSDPQVIVQRDTLTIVERDTVYIQQVEEIEKNFNAAQFEQGKTELNDKAKFALHDLAKLMQQHEELKVLVQGHTSAEGSADFNQRLSEARAKAAVDFLISEGVDESRLKYEGKGSSEPIDPNQPELNRRTEFIVE